eukprot:478733-Alexandrium_andersonii.AAC.1
MGGLPCTRSGSRPDQDAGGPHRKQEPRSDRTQIMRSGSTDREVHPSRTVASAMLFQRLVYTDK